MVCKITVKNFLFKYYSIYILGYVYVSIFLIGNKTCIKIAPQSAQRVHLREKNIYKKGIEMECIETTNSDTVFVVVRPQIRDQSYKELTKISRSWSVDLLISSNVRAFLSCQTDHIKHKGTICFYVYVSIYDYFIMINHVK